MPEFTVRTYFENLLPDSKDIRERIARRFQTKSIDAFTLLTEICRDCVGALQILPEGITPTNVETIQAAPMTEAGVAQLLRGIITPMQMGGPELDNDDFRISIPGAQEKTGIDLEAMPVIFSINLNKFNLKYPD